MKSATGVAGAGVGGGAGSSQVHGSPGRGERRRPQHRWLLPVPIARGEGNGIFPPVAISLRSALSVAVPVPTPDTSPGASGSFPAIAVMVMVTGSPSGSVIPPIVTSTICGWEARGSPRWDMRVRYRGTVCGACAACEKEQGEHGYPEDTDDRLGYPGPGGNFMGTKPGGRKP